MQGLLFLLLQGSLFLLLQGFLYSGDDAGKLCKWTSGLMLEWVKDTYSGNQDISLFLTTSVVDPGHRIRM